MSSDFATGRSHRLSFGFVTPDPVPSPDLWFTSHVRHQYPLSTSYLFSSTFCPSLLHPFYLEPRTLLLWTRILTVKLLVHSTDKISNFVLGPVRLVLSTTTRVTPDCGNCRSRWWTRRGVQDTGVLVFHTFCRKVCPLWLNIAPSRYEKRSEPKNLYTMHKIISLRYHNGRSCLPSHHIRLTLVGNPFLPPRRGSRRSSKIVWILFLMKGKPRRVYPSDILVCTSDNERRRWISEWSLFLSMSIICNDVERKPPEFYQQHESFKPSRTPWLL